MQADTLRPRVLSGDPGKEGEPLSSYKGLLGMDNGAIWDIR